MSVELLKNPRMRTETAVQQIAITVEKQSLLMEPSNWRVSRTTRTAEQLRKRESRVNGAQEHSQPACFRPMVSNTFQTR